MKKLKQVWAWLTVNQEVAEAGRLRRVVMERVEELPEGELLAAFASAPNSGLWKAFMQVLDKKIVACSDAAFDERATDAELRVASGSGKALLELKADLVDYVQRGRQREAEGK